MFSGISPYLNRLALIAGLAAFGLQVQALPAQAQSECQEKVEVARGDTLAGIARRCGISLSTLLGVNPQLNNPDLLEPGDVLNLPSERVVQAESRGSVEVKEGDTLISIADELEIPLAFLLAANPDIDPDEPEPGIVVALPAD